MILNELKQYQCFCKEKNDANDTFRDLHIFFISMDHAVSVMSLTKHCTGCGFNFGINYFYVDEDGTWSEKCKFCQPKK